MSEKAWEKAYRLQCDLDYLLQERDSKPEQVNAKHAWDMILRHSIRELQDIKELVEQDTEQMDRFYGVLRDVLRVFDEAAQQEMQIVGFSKLRTRIHAVLEGVTNVEKDS